jgi:U4/U6 small nuclear ribonucleoprotein PRP31
MAVNVAASSTSGLPLSEDNYARVVKLCEEIIKLDFYHIEVLIVFYLQLLRYIESRMKFIAPNLSSLVGT